MRFWKSKQERELQRDLEFRRGLARIRGFIKKSEELKRRYEEGARGALRGGDRPRFERIAAAILGCEAQLEKWRGFLLDLEMLDLRKDQVRATTSFLNSMKALTRSMLSQASPEEAVRVQLDLDQALARGEALDQALTAVMELSGESVMTLGDPSDDDALKDLEKRIQGDLAAAGPGPEVTGQDERIEEGIRRIEEELRRESR